MKISQIKFLVISNLTIFGVVVLFHFFLLPAFTEESKTDITTTKPLKEVTKSKPEKCPEDMVFITGAMVSKPKTVDEKKSTSLIYLEEFCIDRYEYPNKKDEQPSTNVTWYEAENYCSKLEKRLCTGEEWERGCSGKNSYRYSYGNTFDAKKCGISDVARKDVDKIGSHPKCVSSFGAYDMIGGVWEWTNDKDNSIYVKRGGYINATDEEANCFTRTPQPAKSAGLHDGFRCCKDVNPEAE